ncbi:MAG: hypothetical protein QG641_2968 [Candidatus Poribacteria bacterium]|nr:hypothetical protein [Candidatus Poribacteria bacterium]
MLHFQSPQHSHSRFTQRIPLNSRYFQVCNHPIEILFKKRINALKCFLRLGFYLYLLQFCQCFICFFFALAISKKTSDTQQKTSHLSILWNFRFCRRQYRYIINQSIHSALGYYDMEKHFQKPCYTPTSYTCYDGKEYTCTHYNVRYSFIKSQSFHI